MPPIEEGSKHGPQKQTTNETVGKIFPNGLGAALFLDVDGVLNRSRSAQRGLEPAKLALLKEIVDATACGIVVSSTWRKFEHSRQRIVECLIDIGAELWGFTPELEQKGELWSPTPRGLEIEAWLVAHPEVTRFVILDDDDEVGNLGQHWVKTNSAEGLTADIATEVIRRLRFASSTDGDGR